jgi:hypothetical protein
VAEAFDIYFRDSGRLLVARIIAPHESGKTSDDTDQKALTQGISILNTLQVRAAAATEHPVDGVTIVDNQHLLVGVGCPSGLPTVTVKETRKTVRLRATYSATNFACLRLVHVQLASPLGTRRIIDAATGQTAPQPSTPYVAP